MKNLIKHLGEEELFLKDQLGLYKVIKYFTLAKIKLNKLNTVPLTIHRKLENEGHKRQTG